MAEPVIDHGEVLAAEGAALIAAVRQGPLESSVAACPGWNLVDLSRHLGTTWRWATHVVAKRRQAPGEFEAEPEHLPADEAVAWLEGGLAAVLDALRECPPQAPMWGFGLRPRTAAFWGSRMAQETVVHRVDVERAIGVLAAVEPLVASDGVGELVDVLLPRQYYRTQMPAGQLVVCVTDTGDIYTHGDPAGGVATLRGSAEALLLGLWGRATTGTRLEEVGDPQVLAGWKALGAP